MRPSSQEATTILKSFFESSMPCVVERKTKHFCFTGRNALLSKLEEVIKALNSKCGNLALPRNHNVSTIVSDLAESQHSFWYNFLGMLELECYIAEYKDGKSSGLDGLSAKIVKSCIPVLREPPLYMFNRSLSEGVFPRESLSFSSA